MAEGPTTGQETPGTVGEGGEGKVIAPAAAPDAGAGAPPASVDKTPALRQALAVSDAALDEQRRIQGGLDKTIVDMKAKNAELEGEVKRLNEVAFADDDVATKYEAQLTGARDELSQAQGQIATLQGQLDAGVLENERLRIVASEFPGLAPLLQAGALPAATNAEDFRTKMQALSEQFVPTALAAEHARAQGSRPPVSPAAGGSANVDKLADDMQAALDKGDIARFSELKEQWYAATGDLK